MEVERATREELIELVVRQQAELGLLQAQVVELQARVEQLESQLGGGAKQPAWVKANRPQRAKGPRRPREQGYGRRREEPTELRYHALECCPGCGRQLGGGWEHRRRQVIELELAPVRVIEHVVMARWCGVCGRRWVPTLEAETLGAVGKRRFGVGMQSLVATLHTAARMPLATIGQMLRELFALRISQGGMVDLLEGVAAAGGPELARVQADLRASPVVHGDETGWREDGQNGYLWSFSTPQLRYFVQRRTRSGQVPQEVLGEQFAGVLVSDFYGAYNALGGPHQRCWVHLLRDLHALAEEAGKVPGVSAWVQAVGALYSQARAYQHADPRVGRRAQRVFERKLLQLAAPYLGDREAPQHTLAQRLDRFADELFAFVGDPRVPPHNNAAERALRPAVIARKISGGTRSPRGSSTKTALLSLFGTWSAQRRHLLACCRQLLTSPASP